MLKISKPVIFPPRSTLAAIIDWVHDVSILTRDIANWRFAQKWPASPGELKKMSQEDRARRDPQPRLLPALQKHTPMLCSCLEIVYRADTKSLRVLQDAGKNWATDKSAERVPDCQQLFLEERIAWLTLRRAAFPLWAVSASAEALRRQLMLRRYMEYALRIRDFAEWTIAGWPAESSQRWRLCEAVRPRNTVNTATTPLALAIAEAHRTGREILLAPRLEALEKAIGSYLTAFVRDEGYHDSRIKLHGAISDLSVYSGNIETVEVAERRRPRGKQKNKRSDSGAKQPKQQAPVTPEPYWKQLQLDIGYGKVDTKLRLNGKEFRIRSLQAARLMAALIGADGEAVDAEELRMKINPSKPSSVRIDVLITERLPKPIQKLISRPKSGGRGYALKPK